MVIGGLRPFRLISSDVDRLSDFFSMSCTIESLDTICSIIVSPSYNRTFKIIANNCEDIFKIQLVDGILEKLAISIYIFSLSLSLPLPPYARKLLRSRGSFDRNSSRFKLEFSLRLKICEARERCEIRALPNERCCQIYASLSPDRFERNRFRHGTLQLETRSHREIIARSQLSSRARRA